jgi:hypothetical protein
MTGGLRAQYMAPRTSQAKLSGEGAAVSWRKGRASRKTPLALTVAAAFFNWRESNPRHLEFKSALPLRSGTPSGVDAAAGVTPVGLRPPFVTPAAALSHPDCRGIPILIVAPQLREQKAQNSSGIETRVMSTLYYAEPG